MRNRTFTAVAATLCFCALLNGTTHFNSVNAATLQEAYIISCHRVEIIMNKVQKDRWINLVETGQEEGGGQIADYLIAKRIQADRMQIKTLTDEKGVTNKTLPAIHELYQDGVALAQRYQLATDIIYDYAYFLRWQKEYLASLNLAQWLEQYYETTPDTEGYRKAKVYNLLGILHKTEMRYADAEQYYRKAIDLWQALLQQKPAEMAYEHELANSLCNLGSLLCATNQTTQGKEMYDKAFAIRRRLTLENPDNAACAWNLAASYHAMGNFNKKLKRFDEAKVTLQKAIDIGENLTKKYPAVNEYENSLGNSYCSLANLYRAMGRYEKAELNYYTANMYFARVAERNAAYKLDQAYGYYCMACNYDDMLFERKQAIKLFKRAAKLQEEVIKEHSLAFLNDLRYIGSLSVLTGFVNRYWNKDGEELPVDIQRYLTNETPKAYIRDLADSYERLFTLRWNRTNNRAIEQTGRNALALYELLTVENPALYENDIAHVKFLLGLQCAEQNRHVEAEPLLRDSFRLYMQLVAKEDAESYVERLQTLKMLLNDEEEYLEEL